MNISSLGASSRLIGLTGVDDAARALSERLADLVTVAGGAAGDSGRSLRLGDAQSSGAASLESNVSCWVRP